MPIRVLRDKYSEKKFTLIKITVFKLELNKGYLVKIFQLLNQKQKLSVIVSSRVGTPPFLREPPPYLSGYPSFSEANLKS